MSSEHELFAWIQLIDNVFPEGLYLAISAVRSQRFNICVLLLDIHGFYAITKVATKHGDVAVIARLLRGQEEVRVVTTLSAPALTMFQTLYARHHKGSFHN